MQNSQAFALDFIENISIFKYILKFKIELKFYINVT